MTTARLPLFPLNAVLFPGLVLPLNVFEERYRAMMRELLKSDEDEPRRFVVVAIRDGRETAVTGTGMPDPVASA
ncbi:LON peptidase substrate-binding domain-containing protein, partial [Streptomyces sp. MBT57]|nr:LON peptidase substrate-binding domain-containing protein [Streptomyces sp. MBT57]